MSFVLQIICSIYYLSYRAEETSLVLQSGEKIICLTHHKIYARRARVFECMHSLTLDCPFLLSVFIISPRTTPGGKATYSRACCTVALSGFKILSLVMLEAADG